MLASPTRPYVHLHQGKYEYSLDIRRSWRHWPRLKCLFIKSQFSSISDTKSESIKSHGEDNFVLLPSENALDVSFLDLIINKTKEGTRNLRTIQASWSHLRDFQAYNSVDVNIRIPWIFADFEDNCAVFPPQKVLKLNILGITINQTKEEIKNLVTIHASCSHPRHLHTYNYVKVNITIPWIFADSGADSSGKMIINVMRKIFVSIILDQL